MGAEDVERLIDEGQPPFEAEEDGAPPKAPAWSALIVWPSLVGGSSEKRLSTTDRDDQNDTSPPPPAAEGAAPVDDDGTPVAEVEMSSGPCRLCMAESIRSQDFAC